MVSLGVPDRLLWVPEGIPKNETGDLGGSQKGMIGNLGHSKNDMKGADKRPNGE